MKRRKPENIAQKDWDAVDSPPLTNEILSRMKPVRETHPNMPPRVRGPQKAPLKTPVSLRLDQEIVNYFKARGKGWQSRINDALLDWLTNHKDS